MSRAALDETNSLGFSPGALVQKIPTAAPPRGLRHPQASPSGSKREAFARKNLRTRPLSDRKLSPRLVFKHDLGHVVAAAPPPPCLAPRQSSDQGPRPSPPPCRSPKRHPHGPPSEATSSVSTNSSPNHDQHHTVGPTDWMR
jgi:hypothetical protein